MHRTTESHQAAVAEHLAHRLGLPGERYSPGALRGTPAEPLARTLRRLVGERVRLSDKLARDAEALSAEAFDVAQHVAAYAVDYGRRAAELELGQARLLQLDRLVLPELAEDLREIVKRVKADILHARLVPALPPAPGSPAAGPGLPTLTGDASTALITRTQDGRQR